MCSKNGYTGVTNSRAGGDIIVHDIFININTTTKSLITELIPYGASLIGVVIGALLSMWIFLWKERRNFINKKKAIENELKTNLGLLPQKIDTLQLIKENLKEEKILKGDSVSYSNKLYNSYIGDVGYKIKDLERENLHIIYGNLQQVDKFLNEFYTEIQTELNKEKYSKEKYSKEIVYNYYFSLCNEMIRNCLIVEELIENYLKGKPEKEVTWDENYISEEERFKYLLQYYLTKILRYIKNKSYPKTTEEIMKQVVPKMSKDTTLTLLKVLQKQGKIKKISGSKIKWDYKDQEK